MNARFVSAFNSFVEQVKQEYTTKGILFFGSAQQGKESVFSDLDFYIVVEGEEGWNFKKIINEVPIEAYFLPQCQWQKQINESPHVLRSFATGDIIYDIDLCLNELVAYSKNKYDQGPDELTELQKSNWRITLTELCSDLEGEIHPSANNRIFSGWAVVKALESYCALNRIWSDKTEKLVHQLSKLDSDIESLLTKYNDSPSPLNAKMLVEYVLKQNGGPITEYEGPRIKYKNI